MAMRVDKKNDSEIVTDDMYPFLRRYKDGRIQRLVPNTFVPPSEEPGACGGVATRDVVIDHATGVSARLFLSASAAAATERRLPLVVYFHGSAFIAGSAFSEASHRQATTISARAGALVVSVDYRLAPEHPIPAAYDDGWAALRWATSSSSQSHPWLASYADRRRTFLVGDSAGANIVHNLAVRVTAQQDCEDMDMIGIEGIPFFWGPERLPCERPGRHEGRRVFAPERMDKLWPFVTGGAVEGNEDPRLNPPAEEVASLRCRRALVAVASRDVLRGRGRRYAAWLCGGGAWCREVALVVSEGEDHAFHLGRTAARASAVVLMDRVVRFLHGSDTLVSTDDTQTKLLHKDPTMQQGTNKICRDSSVVDETANPPGEKFRPEPGRAGSSSTNSLACTAPSAPAAVERTVAKSCL
nr:unnamed protein product [Digitaria exilis]